ncbi:MBL fold metallo-hydrolase [Domibacillus mangrovi]|uniref:Metallo-beta-lactamase domain-containing protein n=1 Tax=Domibacillus mangrovi TaxID=1714354 RepID=A0A1Q5P095_9BACI|nr:MBL fold metallo-hydrolase [Domibacillus mangrovi]OKL35685.1 hypothetical protein BLL40_13970 [Domibacillus mangrovi]
MRLTKIGSFYQLSFMPHFFPVNCYIVEEETSLTLVDAALPYSAKGIMKIMKKLEKPIKHIVLTHAHEDHIGAVDVLKGFLPDVPVYISERDARLLGGDVSIDREEAQKPVKGGVPKKMKTRPDILLKEGDRIGSLEAIYSPGHTPGSMSFIDSRNRGLIAGDAFQTRGGMAVSGTVKPFFPFPALATWDKQTAIDSAKNLYSFQPSILAVGHGEMLEQPMKVIEQAIMDAEKKMK